MSEYKRTQTVVDTRLQMHYLTVWVVTTLALIVVGMTFYWYFRQQYESSGAHVPPAYLKLLVGNAFFILFLSLLMGCYAVLHMHRVAGPSYRINQCLKRLVEDDYGFVVSLRKGDYMQDVAANMNALILRLRERNERGLKAREELLALKTALSSGSPSPSDVVGKLEKMIELLPIATPPAAPPAPPAPGAAPAAPAAPAASAAPTA